MARVSQATNTLIQEEIRAIIGEWRYYSETIKDILPGDTERFREATRRLGYPLMNAIPGLVARIDDLDGLLQMEQHATERLAAQAARTQQEVKRLNAIVKEKEQHIASLLRSAAHQ
jgi:hypothetical protein